MRKFLLRWWYTSNWRADTYHRMMLDWNGNWLTPPRMRWIGDPPEVSGSQATVYNLELLK